MMEIKDDRKLSMFKMPEKSHFDMLKKKRISMDVSDIPRGSIL